MSKSKSSPRQSSFLKKEIPNMPKGYYSSGPNPNLRRFVEEHATPYDLQADDYDVPPFDKPIKTTKATAIYNMHTYWSKKPHDAIREYIKHYTKKGDVILDPFCGSGGTALSALMEGRKSIAIDLSPAATFITKNYCTPIDLDELEKEFNKLREFLDLELNWLYETKCDRCDGQAITSFTVYSQIFQCPRCLSKIPLFDCLTTNVHGSQGKLKSVRVCPKCHAEGQIEEIKTTGARFGSIPVMVNYLCTEGCLPQRSQRTYNDPDIKKRKYFEIYDLGKINEIESKEIPYWYPDAELSNVIPYRMLYKQDFRPEDASRLIHFFTKRNLWALSAIINGIKSLDLTYTDTLLFVASSFLLNLTRLYRYRKSGGGQPTGNYYIPQVNRENEAWSALKRKYKHITLGLELLPSILGNNLQILVSTQSAISLSEIDSNTIDHIFTDPPYAGNVQYGELNFVWEAWLGFDFNWHQDEIIINEIRGKTEEDWESMMRIAMEECYRVLKPGRWLSLCYHDTSEGTWKLVQDIMAEVGFISDWIGETLFIDTGQKTYNQRLAEKVAKRDLVLNFRKPRPGELTRQLTLFGDEDENTFSQKAKSITIQTLEAHPGSTIDRLFDELVSRMVRKREFERHNFHEILSSVAEDVDGRWYLLVTADQVDEAESSKEIEVAAHLETFMHQYLQENPGEIGVHYSDLFEQYLPIQDKPRRLIQEWLPEFFFKTDEGTWRPPANEEERSQKETLRSSGTLRRIKRFANALLEGVPPHERDIPANLATAADWIRQCRRAGLYAQGRALYEKGGFTFDSLGEKTQMEVEEDYQICVRRS